MKLQLPPLNALKDFEAAARHLSFSKAADELCVTQGAVSKQVQQLENFLDTQLFKRLGQGLELTDAGVQLANSSTKALRIIHNATAALRATNASNLSLNVMPTFSAKWLIPRLARFQKLYPTVKLDVQTGDGELGRYGLEEDLALRAGTEDMFNELIKTEFMRETLVPVCSPKVKQELGIFAPEDLTKATQLVHTTRPHMWDMYLEGIGHQNLSPDGQVFFEHFFMLIQAVRDNMGVALLPSFMVLEELQRGEVVIPYEMHYESPYRYYIIQKSDILKDTEKAFIKWLKQEVGQIPHHKEVAVA